MQQKVFHFFLFFQFVVLVVLLAAVSIILGPRATATANENLQTILIAASALAVLGCAYLSLVRMRPRAAVGDTPELLPPTKLATNMVLALSLGEVPALLGFALSLSTGASALPYAAVSLACFFLLVLPPVLAYWRSREG